MAVRKISGLLTNENKMAMKENYMTPGMKTVKCELYELIAASFRDDENEVVSDGHAGSRMGGPSDWTDNDE